MLSENNVLIRDSYYLVFLNYSLLNFFSAGEFLALPELKVTKSVKTVL